MAEVGQNLVSEQLQTSPSHLRIEPADQGLEDERTRCSSTIDALGRSPDAVVALHPQLLQIVDHTEAPTASAVDPARVLPRVMRGVGHDLRPLAFGIFGDEDVHVAERHGASVRGRRSLPKAKSSSR